MHNSGGDVNAVQRTRGQGWFRAVKPENQITKPILLRVLHRNENNRATADIGEKLVKNYFRRTGWNQAIRFFSGKNAK